MNEIEANERKLKLELRLAQLNKIDKCKDSFLPFVKSMWAEFIVGKHTFIINL